MEISTGNFKLLKRAWAAKSYLVWLLLGLSLVGTAFSATLSSNAIVRIAYIVPANRDPQPHAVSTLRSTVLLYQRWLADQMQRSGFGPKTFTVETELDGVTPLIHVLSVPPTDEFLRGDVYGGRVLDAARESGLPIGAPGQLWWLIPETHFQFPDGSISGGFDFGQRSPAAPMDGGWAISGSQNLALYRSIYHTNSSPYEGVVIEDIGFYPLVGDVSFPWFEGATFSAISSSALGGGLRSFGEALGLDPDYRNDENFNGNLMGFGFRGIRGVFYPDIYPYNYCSLSYASALALAVNPFLNPDRPVIDTNAPAITITTTGVRASANGLLHITFQASDHTSLHAALLQWERDSVFEMVEEITLSGANVTQTFATPYFNPEETNRYTITVFDSAGNRRSAQTAIYPQATINRSPQPFVFVAPLVAGLGEDIVFDASATFDPVHSANLLEVEWDFDGDGHFDTFPTTQSLQTNNYFSLGTRLIRARITDPAGATAVSAPVAVSITLCPTTLSPLTRLHGFSGSTGAIQVAVGPKCNWWVVNTNAWITILSGESGIGSGEVIYTVQPNPLFAERQGTLLIGDELFLVRQRAIECTFSLSPANRFHGFGIGPNTFKVTAKSGCAWQVVNTNTWIAITSGASGVSTGAVSYAIIAENRVAGRRSGNLVVGDEIFTVNQWGTNCELVLNLASRTHSANSESGDLSVSTANGCAWQVENTNLWISFDAMLGANSSSLRYTVAANTSPLPRSGVVLINGQPFTVLQEACSYSLAPANRSHTYLGQAGTFTVNSASVCPWSVSTTHSWITLLSGPGTGPGVVVYAVSQNPSGSPRSGTIKVANVDFIVSQSGKPCSYALTSDEVAYGEKGGVGEVFVGTETGCPWSVENTASWITITSEATGSGPGRVTYLVSTNTGLERRSTLTIAGQAYAVSQSAGLRTIAAGAMSVASSRTNCLPVTLEARGGENILAFSMCFDTNLLIFRRAHWQTGSIAGATLTVNSSQASQGRVGITFALPAGAGMTSGAQAVIQVCLSARSVTGRVETAISMCDAPVTRRLNDAAGRALPAAFAGGSVQVLGLCTLGEALDAPHLNWTSSSISWSCQTNVVHDAEDAAVSGVFDDDDDSYMEATVTGPGVLSFWWKVSSELNGDILRLYRAGSEQFRISGEVDWEWRQLSIPAGNQVLRWRYSKNGSGFAGADRAWVDQVSFEPAPPTITTQPAHRSVDEGSSITFSVTASGQAPLSYQWLRNGIALPEGGGIRGTRSATLTLSNVQPAQAGFYSVIVGTTGGNVASAAASLSIIPAVLLGEALDAAHLGWFTNGTMGWIGQSGVGRDGVDAARSGPVTHSQSSSLNTVLYGPGTLRFWWKVSSQEDDDRLVFYTNGVEQARLSGEVDWVQRTQTIGAGSNALRWTYSKSSSTSEGQDRAWVDQVEFAPTPVGISSQPANQAVDPGATAVFAVSVSGAPAFTYQWRFNGADLLNSALVRGATTATLTLSNVQAAQAGFYSVLVRNPSGETLSSDASLQVTELVPLPDALDATSFVWTTNGTPPWVGQTAVTRDGSDAARSGRIGDSRTNSFQTTVTGPGSISFWWKVSCETNNDRLRFFVNNSEQQSISGEMDWTWRSFAVGSGNQILEWRYTKNSSVFAGQDRGWVDQINYVPANSPTSPVIALQPTNRTIVAPAAVSFISFAVGSAPLNYQWLFDGEPLANGNGVSGATTTNLTITNSSAAHGGDYSLLVANAAGAVTSSVAKLTVITSPRIVTQPLSQNVLAGSTNTFNATARGTAPLFYQWLRSGTNLINGGNISGATSTNLRLTGVVAANAGSYFFVVTNSAGAATSVVATLTVSTAPSITSQPASRTLPAGSTASFSVTAAGSAPLSFQWRRNGVDLSDGNGVIGSTAATLWISNVQVAASGTYSVVIKNPVGQIVSANAALTAVLPPVIVVQPLGQSVAENATATLTVAASGAAPITYQWRCNGTNVVNGNGLSGATNATLTFTNAHPSRAGVYSVEVSNPGGSVSSADAPLVVIPKITLAEAVNAPYLEWTTKTNAPWIAQTNVTHDGEFAAQSATIAGSNNTWIETMVVGPGTIRFWWKVSSQTNADTLAFSLNGAEWSRISGGVDWQKMSFPVPAGPLTLRWTYTKDAAVTSGFDRAWLDEVDFLPNTAPSAPVIVSQPGSADLDLGSTATFAVEALGTGPLNYQWRFEGQNIGDDVNVLGASSPTLRLFNVQAAQSGLYDVVVRNAYSLQISQPAYLNVLTTIPLEFALDTENTNLLWRTGGYSPWLGQTKLSSDNFDSAQSSPVAHRATNWVETILPGPCALAFWWKVSSETNRDRLRFLVNGVEQANISGETPWRQRAFPITATGARVRWEYAKDASGSAGQDRGWVDRIEMLAISPLITNSAPDTNIVEQGTTVRFKVEASGTSPFTYQWKHGATNLPESIKVIGATTSSRLILSNAQPNQTGLYTCIVGNESGVDTSEQMYLRVNPVAPIGPAVNPALVWETGGYSWFVGTTADSRADGQSARNGYVDDEFSTWMRTTVNGPGTVTYWWRASTQPNADFLSFYINGFLQGRISGNVAWQQRTFGVPDGPAVLQWEYAKDLIGTNGLDQVFVDEVVFTPLPPAFTNQPVAQDADVGSTVTFTAGARGGPPLSYRWHYNLAPLSDGGNISGAATPTLQITGVQLSHGGSYFLRVTNVSGTATSPSATLTVTPVLPLAQALDTTNIVWATTSPGWIGQPLVTRDGVDAARSPALSALQASPVQATLTGPALVSFWWRVSSETNGDYMAFFVGGAEQARISGEVNWQQRSFNVPAGNHSVGWVYAKNGSGTSGQDRGWVDQFVYTATAPVIMQQPVSQVVDEGARVTFAAATSGLQPLTYQWRRNGIDVSNGPGVSGARTSTLVISNALPSHSGTYSLFVSNSAATTLSSGATLSVIPLIPLAIALDTPNLVWTTNGTVPWAGQPLVSHDGVDAARSGLLPSNGSNSIQTAVTGPGTIGFWWKVSSETNNDRLVFHVNNVEQARISGEVNWAFRNFTLGAGNQTLRWTYSKNGSVAGGEDRAWVDEVAFVPMAPTIASQPANQAVDEGDLANFRVIVSGTPPFTYQWQRDGINLVNGSGISGATSSNLVLNGVQLSQAGAYRVAVGSAAGSITSAAATLTVLPSVSLPVALDAAGLAWTANGTPAWIGQRAVTHDGMDAARSGTIGNSTTSRMETTVNGPATLNFWWKISCETNNDWMSFAVDGTEQARISGEVNWAFRSFNISSGSHVLSWTYSKNGSGVAGQDRAWVDEVQFGVVAPIITAQPTNRLVNPGNTAAFSVSAAGTAPLTYRWHLNGTPLANGGAFSGTTTPTLTIANVQSAQLGNYSVIVSNVGGTVLSASASLALVPTLNEALDGAGLTFTTGGTAQPWTGQRAVTHDGSDAAQTGTTTQNSTYTWVKTTVSGPGTLTFWWKVSSEEDHDYLRFMLDAVDQVRISGEVDWQQITFNVPSGSHELQWRYSRSPADVGGQDRGWLDQVSFVPGGSPAPVQSPKILIQPISQTVDEGDTANLGVLATASDPLDYQWFFNTNALADTASLGGATTPELTAFNVLSTQGGNYFVVLSNALGAVTSRVARLTINRIIPLSEAVDAPELFFMTEGARPWEGHPVVTHDGMDAARSGQMNDGERNSVQTMVDGPGTLSFWWKVSSETNSDTLTLSLDGRVEALISGEVDWEERSLEVPAGPQFIEWTYSKNDSLAAGQDGGWLDQVSFLPFGMAAAKAQPIAALAPRLSIIANRAVLTWEARTRRSYEVLYKDDLSETEWKPCDTEILAKWKILDGAVQPETYTATAEELPGAQTRFYRVLEY